MQRLEKKYGKKINDCIKRNKDKTMAELDEIKADMKTEMEAKGLIKIEV